MTKYHSRSLSTTNYDICNSAILKILWQDMANLILVRNFHFVGKEPLPLSTALMKRNDEITII